MKPFLAAIGSSASDLQRQCCKMIRRNFEPDEQNKLLGLSEIASPIRALLPTY